MIPLHEFNAFDRKHDHAQQQQTRALRPDRRSTISSPSFAAPKIKVEMPESTRYAAATFPAETTGLSSRGRDTVYFHSAVEVAIVKCVGQLRANMHYAVVGGHFRRTDEP